jgi:prefoldin subunit 5
MNALEIADLRKQVSEVEDRIQRIKSEKEENLRDAYNAVTEIPKTIEELEKNINSLKKEIGDRQIHPEWYNVSAGAGTLAQVVKNIQDHEKRVKNLKLEMDYHNELLRENDFDEAIEDLEEDRERLLYTIADMIGLENLKNERRSVGKAMSKHYRLQKEAYDLQKERYEDCKKTFGFTPEDREFIAHHTGVKDGHQATYDKLREKRNELTELIELLDPNDQDHGFDEEED